MAYLDNGSLCFSSTVLIDDLFTVLYRAILNRSIQETRAILLPGQCTNAVVVPQVNLRGYTRHAHVEWLP